jgi:uncharacterized delta-60 repeat protein
MQHCHFAFVAATAVAAAIPSATAATRNGDPDPNFGTDGATLVDIGDGLGVWVALARLPDGKLLLGGTYDAGAPTGQDMVVARLDTDGRLDNSFSFDGKVEIVVGPGDSMDTLFDLLVQPDGRIVLAGTAESPDPADGIDMAIVRLNADGSFDGSFGAGGKVFVDFGLGSALNEEQARAIARFPDGKLIVAGSTPVAGADSDMALVKLNPDGSRDTSFGTGGRRTVRFELSPTFEFDAATAVAVDSLGRVVVAGSTAKDSMDDQDFAVARLLANSQLDPAFSGDGRHTVAFDVAAPYLDQAFGLILGSDDSITLVGTANDNEADMAAVRLQPDGSPVAGFGNAGKVTIPFDLGVSDNREFAMGALAHDDRLLLVGTGFVDLGGAIPEQTTMLAQLLPDGQLDPGFGQFGKVVLANSFGGTAMASTTALADRGRALLPTIAGTPGDGIALAVQSVLLDVVFSDGYDGD